MTGIGGTPPLSPRKPPTSPQDDGPKPRALEVKKKSPRTNFPISRVEALRRRKEEKEREIIESLSIYKSEEFRIVIENALEEWNSEPVIETVQVVSSPRGDFKSKLNFFENLSKGDTATTTTTSSVPPSRPLPPLPSRGGDEPLVQSPRRVARGDLPEMREKPAQDSSRSEKPS